jgi:phosphatidate cytidylyltransferase
MKLLYDAQFQVLLGGLIGVLTIASLVGWLLSRRANAGKTQEVIANLNARIKAWWGMVAIFLLAVAIGSGGSIVLFALISFLALREYLAISPTIRGDHHVLHWLVFIVLPANYILVAIQWYGLFAIFIPVYAFIWLETRAAIEGAAEGFLDRTARIQWGMMMAVYFVGYVPALLMLQIPRYSENGNNFKLLLFLAITAQVSDVAQYVSGKLFGKHPIAPRVSPNKTVEGFTGGIAFASALGAGLYWITPFSIAQAGALALIIFIMGFAGGLVMSATKRDRGVKDFGALLPGHGGILDRIDSFCFAAPIFFHLTRYFFAA